MPSVGFSRNRESIRSCRRKTIALRAIAAGLNGIFTDNRPGSCSSQPSLLVYATQSDCDRKSDSWWLPNENARVLASCMYCCDRMSTSRTLRGSHDVTARRQSYGRYAECCESADAACGSEVYLRAQSRARSIGYFIAFDCNFEVTLPAISMPGRLAMRQESIRTSANSFESGCRVSSSVSACSASSAVIIYNNGSLGSTASIAIAAASAFALCNCSQSRSYTNVRTSSHESPIVVEPSANRPPCHF
jgi:hypothetical protein